MRAHFVFSRPMCLFLNLPRPPFIVLVYSLIKVGSCNYLKQQIVSYVVAMGSLRRLRSESCVIYRYTGL